MRLIGMGLMAFLLAGIALFLARSDAINQSLQLLLELREGPQLNFEVQTPVRVAKDNTQAVIRRMAPDTPIILSGLPAYHGAAFAMPIDARPTSGYLQIDATYQVLAGVEGILRISIDNTRRAEMLLHPGEAGRSVRIQLTAEEIARTQLVVSFSLQGQGSQSVCGPDDGVEAVVEIETTSAIYLELDTPLNSIRDRLASWGNVTHLAWPLADASVQRETLLQAVRLQRQDQQISFEGDYGLSLLETQSIAANFAKSDTPRFAWQASMANESPLFNLRRFYRSTSWRIRYDLRHGSERAVPSRLDLSMVLGKQAGDDQWQILVTLNNRLLHQSTVSGGQTEVSAAIELPTGANAAINELEIIAVSSHRSEGLCDEGPELVAQLLPSTQFHVGDIGFADDVTALRDAIARFNIVGVTLHDALSPIEATVAVDLLASIAPRTDLRAAPAATEITVLARGATLPTVWTPQSWLVYRDARTRSLIAEPLGHASTGHLGNMALLVTLEGEQS